MDKSLFEIKRTLFGKTVLKKNGKTILKAHQIVAYAPSAGDIMTIKNPMFVTIDQEGNHSVYSVLGNKPIIKLQNAQAGRHFFKDGFEKTSPMVFNKDGQDIYLSPEGTAYPISINEELCFVQDVSGNPTHSLVFKVVDGKPIPLFKSPEFSLAKPFYLREGMAQYPLIARYRHSDSVQNAYLPLMITNLSDLEDFCKALPPTQKDYSSLKDQYLSLTLSKRATPLRAHEAGSEYLNTIQTNFQKIATASGRYSLEIIPTIVKTNTAKIRLAKRGISISNIELAEQTRQLEQLRTQQDALSFIDQNGDYISGYRDHYDEMVFLDNCIGAATTNVNNCTKNLTRLDTCIKEAESSNQEMASRQLCIGYTDKLAASIGKIIVKTAALAYPMPEQIDTEENSSTYSFSGRSAKNNPQEQ